MNDLTELYVAIQQAVIALYGFVPPDMVVELNPDDREEFRKISGFYTVHGCPTAVGDLARGEFSLRLTGL